ncbi:hypothetical protein FPZ49_08095 [Paenibacillus cremeus]|uniref:Uncharacterized protein n=1 Tax=Paenibacillus cremeus TaxID=2163881 RepID=A0A559KDZ5_9BACL|nr:hypothetical protein FPZ49_08095 [Paenibacillus cremeus]
MNDDPSGGRNAEDRYLLLRLIAISNFVSIDRPLYNVLVHGSNMTDPSTREHFNEIKRIIYYKVLQEWGDGYEPVFAISTDGWLDVIDVKIKAESDE